jgi:predicted ATPase/DNA-binding CsgD family transcriptional regulator
MIAGERVHGLSGAARDCSVLADRQSHRGRLEGVHIVAAAQPLDQSTPLPTPLTPLIGREREVSAVRDMLRNDAVRLVTLTGPGGVGKTRLAIQVASSVQDAFPDGVVFVSLASVHDPELVLPAIAQALELPEISTRPLPEQLTAVLRQRRLLVVLDNIEQVVEAAPYITTLLGGCPGLKALVTSRTVLRLSGEHDFPVLPLALLDRADPARLPPLDSLARNDAFALFTMRAQAAQPGFALTEVTAPTVAEICWRLDGLPLAIELAAAWVRVLSPEELASRLTSRLTLLTGGARDQPARLRSMRDAIAWSHDLLPPAERLLFRRLAVFAGGFTFEAAEAVIGARDELGGDLLTGILSLVEASLLTRSEAPGDVPRYRMLETIREFALEHLAASGEADGIMERLAEWSFAMAAAGYDQIFSPSPLGWLERCEAELDNVRAVLSWALERGNATTAQGLCGALFWFWYIPGHLSEGRTWGERAIALDDARPAPERMRVLGSTATLAWGQGDYPRARVLCEEAVALADSVGTVLDIGRTRHVLGLIAEDEGRYDEAEALQEESLARFRSDDRPEWIGNALNALGVIAYERGEMARASEFFTEALDQYRLREFAYGKGRALTNLAKIARDQGDFAHAAALYGESLALRWAQGEKPHLAGCLRGLASVAAAARHYTRAARLYGAAEAMQEAIGAAAPRHHAFSEQAVAKVRSGLGETTFADEWAAGRALPLAEAVAEALAVTPEVIGAAADKKSTPATRHGLTPREGEVLSLVREGCTNREIGERLFISERTARTHVQNILDKLDVSTRAAAAAYAVEHGIVPRRSPESEGQAVTVAASP